jgi:hydroxymethylpyrimidine pyrophosphatase-like HAD family hydrolase
MQQFLNVDSRVIAVDFDGTIVEHKFPAIGKEMLFAFATLKALQQKGHKLILWTIRTGDLLKEAVDYCEKNGVQFYAINKNYPEEILDDKTSRKLNAEIFIDDRNVGGFIGWSEVWNTLHPEGGEFAHQLKNPEAHNNHKKNEGSLLKKLFGSK